MVGAVDKELSRVIAAERFKYILSQKEALNANTFAILRLYQVVAIGTFAAGYVILKDAHAGAMTGDLLLISFTSLYVAFMVCNIITLLSLGSGMLSWAAYKREECEVLTRSGITSVEPIRLRNFYRWYETYVIILLLLVCAVSTVFFLMTL